MAKLVLTILHQLDADNVVTALEEAGHRLTRIPSVGGFLGVENVTLLMAVEDDNVDAVTAVIERFTSGREMELPLFVQGRLKDELPSLVRYGGATILIANLESVRHV